MTNYAIYTKNTAGKATCCVQQSIIYNKLQAVTSHVLSTLLCSYQKLNQRNVCLSLFHTLTETIDTLEEEFKTTRHRLKEQTRILLNSASDFV